MSLRLALAATALILLAPACERESAPDGSAAAAPDEASAALAVAEATPTAKTAVATDSDAEHVEACGAANGEVAAATEAGATCGMPGSGCDRWDDEAAEVTKREVPADAVWTTWQVEGMHCGGCERRVIAKVGQIEGVVGVKANAGTGRVSVAIAPGAEAHLAEARAGIATLGYRVGDETPSL